MPKTYLYIPFTEKENNTSLEDMALSWITRAKHKNQIPQLLVHGEDKIPNLKAEDQIYILGHGTPNEVNQNFSDLIANDINNKEQFLITPSEIANRLIKDGLNPNMSGKIKLYFCDESGRAKEKAGLLCKGLIELNKKFSNSKCSLKIFYYNAFLTLPSKINGKKGAFKLKSLSSASPDEKEIVKSPQGDLYSYQGRASKFRQEFKMSFFQDAVLKNNKSSNRKKHRNKK